MKRTLIVASFSAAALLGGCSTTPDGSDVYTQESVGQVMRVETGTVVGLRAVKIRLTDSEGVGTASGAVIGGVVGSGVGLSEAGEPVVMTIRSARMGVVRPVTATRWASSRWARPSIRVIVG